MVSDRVVHDLLADPEKWIRLLSLPHRGDATHRSGEIVPFVPTPIQLKYLEIRKDKTKSRRRAILKARQQLISTIVLASNLMDVMTIPGTRALTLTHTDQSTQLFRLTVRQWCHQLADLGLLPSIENDNDDLLSFKNMNSFMVFQTAAGKMGGRSTSFNRIHLSEIAFWQRDPSSIIGGIIPSAPQDAEIDIESTPNGAEGPLHDYYTDAKNGDIEWEAIFLPWFENPEYVREVSEPLVLNIEEAKLKLDHKLTDSQLAWRRWQMAEMKNTRKNDHNDGGIFKQEYPEDDISCFLSGEDLVLDSEALQDFIRLVQPSLVEFEEWEIWKAPVVGQPYVVSCDSSDGKNDYSAANIMDAVSLEVVARYHARTIPAHFAEVINKGARAYNNALVVVETPGPGTVVLDRLMMQFGYTNVYYYVDDVTGKVNDDPGWPQNVKTRSRMIDTLQTLTQSRAYRTYDERTVRELASLTWRKVGTMKRARAEAAPGTHDDLVFALGLGLCTAEEALRLHRKGLKWRSEPPETISLPGGGPPRRAREAYREFGELEPAIPIEPPHVIGMEYR